MLLIKNAHLINPADGTEMQADILTEEGRISCIAPADTLQIDNAVVIDAAGLIAAPGLVDTHVHFRDPGFTYKEDIESGAKAAAAGGMTSVVLMANTSPKVDNPETLHYIIEKGKKTSGGKSFFIVFFPI